MSNNSKMCPMPFTSMHIEPDGRIKICCNDNPGVIPTDNNGNSYNVNTHKLSDFWNSDHVQTVRKQFINGEQPVSCRKCWETELIENNSSSVRIGAISRLKDLNFDYNKVINKCDNGYLENPPIDYQIMVGNLCNLGCKMCAPDYSTNFSKFFKSKGFETMKKVKFHSLHSPDYFKYAEKSYGVIYDWPKKIGLSKIFSEYNDNILEMVITGGEPTIVTENIEFLEYLGKKDKDITLRIATNCTNINKKILSALDKFNKPRIMCSIDGMNEIAAIQRTYSNWTQVEKNLKMLYQWSIEKPNRHIYVHSVLTALNFHHIVDFWNYIFKNYPLLSTSYLPIVNVDNPLGIALIPQRFKTKLLDKIENYKYADTKNKFTTNILNLKNYINSINFSKSDKEFFNLLDFMQELHPEYNIKEVYHFYYE